MWKSVQCMFTSGDETGPFPASGLLPPPGMMFVSLICNNINVHNTYLKTKHV